MDGPEVYSFIIWLCNPSRTKRIKQCCPDCSVTQVWPNAVLTVQWRKYGHIEKALLSWLSVSRQVGPVLALSCRPTCGEKAWYWLLTHAPILLYLSIKQVRISIARTKHLQVNLASSCQLTCGETRLGAIPLAFLWRPQSSPAFTVTLIKMLYN